MTRVVGILNNIVPYHHARWEAFAQSAGVGCEVVEFTNRDAFCVLEFAAGARYRRRTLFPSDTTEVISGKALNCAMAAALEEFRPEVVCISGYAFRVSLAALQWAVRRGVPVVVLSESNEFDEPRSAFKEFIKRRVVGLCSAGLAGGTPQKEYLVKLGLAPKKVFLGYDVVDNRHFEDKVAESKERKAESGEEREGNAETPKAGSGMLEAEIRPPSSVLRLQYGLPERYFLACSRFGEKKNIPRLIQAYAKYREKAEKLKAEMLKSEGNKPLVDHRPQTTGLQDASDVPLSSSPVVPWSLVIVGDGEKRPEIEATISRLGVAGGVHLAGAKSFGDIPAYYALAGAFVHASTTEQWGLVVNEAMASGLPVLVSSRCGCAPDLVQEGVNGFTFDPYNVEELAQLMFKISAFQPSSLSACGDASRRIIADWGPDRFASGLKSASECALRVGPAKPTLLQRILLHLLLRR